MVYHSHTLSKRVDGVPLLTTPMSVAINFIDVLVSGTNVV